jgi:hypothetical protein
MPASPLSVRATWGLGAALAPRPPSRSAEALTIAVTGSLALLACDPSTSLRGQLTHADGSGVAGATVRTVCANQSGSMTATTDVQGRFSTSGIGCVGDDCHLEVLAPGRDAVTLPVTPHCQGTALGCGKGCSDVEIRIVVK